MYDAARELLVGLAFGPVGIVGLVAAALVVGVLIGAALSHS